MTNGKIRVIGIVIGTILICRSGYAQISPGDLSKDHESLEGISNCTKCHIIGNKITGEKCLDCHTEIKERILAGKGYHSSSVVKAKQCIECHSDHHGKNFQLVRMNTGEFDHSLAGFTLSTPHSRLQCQECHNAKFTTGQKIAEKKFTYMGVKTECLTCHADYHLNTLSTECLNCHGSETFKTVPAFSHDKARFRLADKHKNVECIKCHKVETVNGNKFQEFRGVAYASCVNCHADPHHNKFGQNCRQCHSEVSFTTIKGISDFDHNKTNFPLVDKHLTVDCKSCHKTNLTDPLKHDRCTDCHSDYHKGQFVKNGISPDCSECHSVKGFTSFSYTLEQHNKSPFPLMGAHSAQPCSECHKKQTEWSFKGIGTVCLDCHSDIHKTFIGAKYYPDENCRICHNESAWSDVSFDHSKTGFPLTGEHTKPSCATCHITRTSGGTITQKFADLPSDCSACHNDNHQGQFNKNMGENCTDCHVTENWKASKFDHNKTDFKIDGEHVNVSCAGCHKPQQIGSVTYTLYKIKDYKCESCHF
jgi:nitrate/TMAO reductase-like tetraheme cytochrome c subunit